MGIGVFDTMGKPKCSHAKANGFTTSPVITATYGNVTSMSVGAAIHNLQGTSSNWSYQYIITDPYIALEMQYFPRKLDDYFRNRKISINSVSFETVEEYDKRLFYEDLLNDI